jgi:hypothetical protein
MLPQSFDPAACGKIYAEAATMNVEIVRMLHVEECVSGSM